MASFPGAEPWRKMRKTEPGSGPQLDEAPRAPSGLSMGSSGSGNPSSDRNAFGGWNVSLGRIFGVRIEIHWSLVLIFALALSNLGFGVFRTWHPEWSPAVVWTTATGAALLLFVSIVLHELSHSLVARLHGIGIRGITLFMFGGVSRMERDASTPAAEFAIAVAGPAMSLLIGIASLLAATGGNTAPLVSEIESAGPLRSLLLWLGPVNILLGIFNLLPAFPLDGGRVFRSVVWWATGDLLKATRWAAIAGTFFAWGLIAFGIVSVLDGLIIQGVWLVLIGWFLNHMARIGYEQQHLRSVLDGVTASGIMHTDLGAVPVDLPVSRLIDEYLLTRGQTDFAVVADGRLEGLVRLDDVRAVPNAERSETTVESVMTRVEKLVAVQGAEPATVLLQELESGNDPVFVVDRGHIVGWVHQRDIVKWMALLG